MARGWGILRHGIGLGERHAIHIERAGQIGGASQVHQAQQVEMEVVDTGVEKEHADVAASELAIGPGVVRVDGQHVPLEAEAEEERRGRVVAALRRAGDSPGGFLAMGSSIEKDRSLSTDAIPASFASVAAAVALSPLTVARPAAPFTHWTLPPSAATR